MNLVRVARVIAIVACAASVITAEAQTVSPPVVTIRVYDATGRTAEELTIAQHTAEAILEAAGVTVRWRECWRDHGGLRRGQQLCGDTLQPTEVVVRIVSGLPETQGGLMALGYSLVVGHAGVATLATVFGNRVTELARRVNLDFNTLMGRAMAHEVGHLLLGTSEHGTAGLMRAHWSDVALKDHERDWQFMPREAHRIRVELALRSGKHADLLAVNASMLVPVVPVVPPEGPAK